MPLDNASKLSNEKNMTLSIEHISTLAWVIKQTENFTCESSSTELPQLSVHSTMRRGHACTQGWQLK
jgi:hypothetical protein